MAARKRRTEQERVREAAEAMLRLSAADLSAHAARPEYQQFPPRFHMTCRKYAKREHWTLHESACLLGGFDPERPRDVLPGHEAWDHYIREIEERVERSSLWVGGKTEHEYLRATDVMAWALSNLILVPRALLWAMGYEVPRRGDPWVEVSAALRPNESVLHSTKRKTRDIAKRLWADNPRMTIAAVIKHPDILQVAGHYAPGTRHKWVCTVDPRPPHEKAGRPPKPDAS